MNLAPLSVEVPPESGYRLLNPPQDNPDSPVPNGFDDVEGIELQLEKLRTLHINLEGFEQTTVPVTVRVVGPRGEIRRAQTTTDSLIMQLPGTDEYAVYAESGSIASQVEDVPFTVDETKVELLLGQAAIVHGKAVQEVDPETTTPRLCRVRIETPTESGKQFTLLETACAESGDFLFPVLPYGQTVLFVRNPSGTRQTSQILTLRPGRNGPFEFSFPAGKTMAGIVQDQKAVKVPAALVEYSYLNSSGELTSRTVEADESGKSVLRT